MTKTEAIENLKWLRECSYIDEFEAEDNEALDMAIKALEQEPSGDLISRQAVLDLLEDTNNGWIINEVSQLPQESETWNGIHAQITAPKGTFDKIWEDAESEDER